MSNIEIGSVTIFINVPDEIHGTINDGDIHDIESQVVEKFLANAERFGVDQRVVTVSEVNTKTGCLLCTIGLCAITTSSVLKTAAGVSTFIIAYPKLCDGLELMAKHVGHVKFKIKNRKEIKQQRTALYQSKLETQQEVERLMEHLKKRKRKRKR